MPNLPSIVVRDLVKTFRLPGSAATVKALDLPTLEVQSGETVAIIGPSGSGKTTLLHIIAGLLPPSEGEVLVNGTAIHTLGERARGRLRARTIGYVFQAFNLLPAFSVLENVRIAMDLCHVVPAVERRERARLLLVELGLGARMHHKPGQLSAGEQQRVGVAQALANGPQVLLADESTASVDQETRTTVLHRLLVEAKTGGKVVMVATHDHGLLASFDRVQRLGNVETNLLSVGGENV
jgi:ABC-type lipoprotein export system ATPase subunit